MNLSPAKLSHVKAKPSLKLRPREHIGEESMEGTELSLLNLGYDGVAVARCGSAERRMKFVVR